MKTAEVRDAYLSFFAERDHRVVPSSTLVPQNDPTLLFTNAGMNQFKDPLLGRSDPGYKRAVSSQRCVRAGGKHNDLENVGYTARHHTFFEMLGNFSFGDYFKEETITWAWEFVHDVLQLPAEKIWVTVHPTDADARALWEKKIGLPADRVIDLEENFWTMGDTGPCGPCTELFYDHGPEVAGGPPGSPDEDGDRFIEFWNLVFPQFDRSADGELAPLPQPGVDTGMGLERTAAIMQGVHSNYEIDLFQTLLTAAGKFAGNFSQQEALANASLRVIADHIRSSAFLVADGVTPGNEDRAYVLRRIIRRALRHGYQLNIRDPFFHRLVEPLVEEMGEAYPLLAERADHISSVLAQEEARFSETLAQGMQVFNTQTKDLTGDTIPGETVFLLYDTYGFPADLTADVARERNLKIDEAGFEAAMEAQRERGRAAASFSTSLGQKVNVAQTVEFSGYETLGDDATVLGVFDEAGEPVAALAAGARGVVVLDRTPFYAEAGGQVGDRGELAANDARFDVDDTLVSGVQHMHLGTVTAGEFTVGQNVSSRVDGARRDRIRSNHSATHLLHAALRETLGAHVQQKGSLVNDEKLRFDFSHEAPVTAEEIATLEQQVNAQILANSEVTTQHMAFDAAVDAGAMALFGEKYDDEVRVLTMGDGYSVELCGGTHVQRTGDIGFFKITSEAGIAAGVRRIEAVTGLAALGVVHELEQQIGAIAEVLKSSAADTVERVQTLVVDSRAAQKRVEELTQKLAASQGSDLLDGVVDIHGAAFLAARVDGDNKAMMQTLDTLKSQLKTSVLLLAHEAGGRVGMVAAVSGDLTDRLSAVELLNESGAAVGVKGGGKPDLARGGGGDKPEALNDAFAAAQALASDRLA